VNDPMGAALDRYLTTPPEDNSCEVCADAGCVDGEIVGRGSMGENVEEKCSHSCHEDPEALEEQYEEERSDAQAWRDGV